jgi:hypothetical protein
MRYGGLQWLSLSVVLQSFLEHARLVVRNKDMWLAILLCTTYVCAWFRAAAAWTWTLLRRISIFILGCTSSQAFRDSLNEITLFDVIKATSLVLRL